MKEERAYNFWKRIDSFNNEKTILELSNKNGINYATIKTQRSRNKMPNVDIIYTLAKALNVSMEFLISGEGEKKDQYPTRVKAIADKLCKVSEQDLSLIERNVHLLPIDEYIQPNVIS